MTQATFSPNDAIKTVNAQPNEQEKKNPNWETKIFSLNNSQVKGRLKTEVAEYLDSNPKHTEGCS